MANYYRKSVQKLDDIHGLLPREILGDIGIIEPAEQQLLDVVEDLAAHLVGVLGGTAKMASCHHPKQAPNVARGMDGRDVLAAAGNVRKVAAPPFLPAPPVPWQVMEALRNPMVLHPAAAFPCFTPARPLLVGGAQSTTACRSGGTGVFLPRTDEALRSTDTAKQAARPPSKDVKPVRQNRAQKQWRGEQAATMAMIRKQHEMQAMAAQMEQRYHDARGHPELRNGSPEAGSSASRRRRTPESAACLRRVSHGTNQTAPY